MALTRWGTFFDAILKQRGYFAPHRGRPGKRGGSAPRDAWSIAGITSYQAERGHTDPKLIEKEMLQFVGTLKKLGIRDVKAELALGAWPYEGKVEHEYTWYLQYRGDGRALSALAEAAQKYGQHNVIVFTSDPAGDASYTQFIFDTPLMPKQTEIVETFAKDSGFGGWVTGRRYINFGHVPIWQSAGDYQTALFRFSQALRNAGLRARARKQTITVTVMGEGATPYAEFLRKAEISEAAQWFEALPEEQIIPEGYSLAWVSTRKRRKWQS